VVETAPVACLPDETNVGGRTDKAQPAAVAWTGGIALITVNVRGGELANG
jgi:hypothetical protein